MRQASPEDRDWWTSIDEAYWRAVLRQGEHSPETAPPTDPQEIFGALGIEPNGEAPGHWPRAEASGNSDAEDKWETARRALERGELSSVRVAGANRGGLLVEWNGLHGFVPASHLNEMPRHLNPDERGLELASRIGDAMTVLLIEVDPQQNQLVFSERAAVQLDRTPTDLLNTLKPGDVCQGTVTTLTTFGVFVDLGGVEGLVHISELSWERVRHPADLLRSGQSVQVQVLGVNPEEGRVALSLKRLRPDPWSRAESLYQVGQLVAGAVTSVVSFGAFVRVQEGLEGLIHISELAEGNFLHPRDVVREGDVIQVRVLSIDTAHHRMGLSLRQAYSPSRMTPGED